MPAPVVFTGLSLSQEEARTLLAAEVRPPVKRGDLDQLSDGTVAAIIDGELSGDSAVPIDEIRRALRRGVKISGAASVGALRAYEAREEGMVGLGWVYRAYCTGRISGIDEIAVIYDPDFLSFPHDPPSECSLLPGAPDYPAWHQRGRGRPRHGLIEAIESRKA